MCLSLQLSLVTMSSSVYSLKQIEHSSSVSFCPKPSARYLIVVRERRMSLEADLSFLRLRCLDAKTQHIMKRTITKRTILMAAKTRKNPIKSIYAPFSSLQPSDSLEK